MKFTQNTDFYLQNFETCNYLTAKSTQGHTKPWRVDMNTGLITWEIIKQQDNNYFIRNKLTKGHLDGGGKYVRAAEDGITNADWIKWKLVPNNDGTFLIVNVKNGGFLDGGPTHLRPQFHGSNVNPTWIQWRIKHAPTF
jgi:hypothetical protein